MNERQKLMQKIYERGFTLDEMILYLDTHPGDKKGLAYYEKAGREYGELKAEYESCYGPLSVRCPAGRCGCGQEEAWKWIQGTMPWQGGC